MTPGERRAAVWPTVLAASVTLAHTAAAQSYDSEVRIDQLQPSSAGSPFTRAEGPHERFTEGIAYALRLIADYGYQPLRTRVVGGEPNVPRQTSDKSPVEHALLMHASASLSPAYWVNLELDMPFAVYESGSADLSVNAQPIAAGTAGPGDLRLGAHFRPVSSERFDLSLGARFWAVTGSRAAYLSGPDRFFRLEAVLSAAGEADFLKWGCTLGIAPLWFAGRDGDRLAASCGALFDVSTVVSLGIEPHFAAYTYAAAGTSDQISSLTDASFALAFEPMGSMLFHAGDFHIGLSGGAGIGGAPGTPTARGLLHVTYAARGERVVERVEMKNDADLDGTVDGYDACPEEAGPKDRRGCPEKRDLDGDNIIEGDACPDQAGAMFDDPEVNGCPDRDNDRIADPRDPCPTEPGESNGGCPRYARLKGKTFTIEPPIAFAGASLSDTGVAALLEVIHTLRANPKLRQISVRLGTKGAGNRLTDQRAAVILGLFSDQNIDSSRFELVLADDLRSGQVKIRVIR